MCPTSTIPLPWLSSPRPVLFFSAVRQMPGHTAGSWAKARIIPRYGAISEYLILPRFCLNLTLNMTDLGLNLGKPSNQIYAPSQGLLPLEQWRSFCPSRGLQPRREIVNVSAIPVVVQCVCYWAQRWGGMAKHSEGRLRPQLFGYLLVSIAFIATGTASQNVGK